MLSVIERYGRPPYGQLPLAQARAEMRRGAVIGARPGRLIGAVRDIEVTGADGPLAARHYVPAEAKTAPASPHPVLPWRRLRARRSRQPRCSVPAAGPSCRRTRGLGRLPPGSRASVPGRRRRRPRRAALGIRERRTARRRSRPDRGRRRQRRRQPLRRRGLGGRARRRTGAGVPVLLYPATDFVERAARTSCSTQGFLLTREDMDWFSDNYTANADLADPRLSILRADGLEASPRPWWSRPALTRCATRARRTPSRCVTAGVPVMVRRFPGLIHGFINMTGVSRTSRDALVEIGGATRALLRSDHMPRQPQRNRAREQPERHRQPPPRLNHMKIAIFVYEGFDELDAIGPVRGSAQRRPRRGRADDRYRVRGWSRAPTACASSHRGRWKTARSTWSSCRAVAGTTAPRQAPMPRPGVASCRPRSAACTTAARWSPRCAPGRCCSRRRDCWRSLRHHPPWRARGASRRRDRGGQARVVDDGDLLSCGGVTSGIDLALWLVEREWGAELADKVAREMEHPRSTSIWRSSVQRLSS